MRVVMLGLLCAIALCSVQLAAAAEDGAPGEVAMDGGGMPQAPAGKGTHPICWLEIEAKDMAAATQFYGQAFGWTFQGMGDDYMMWVAPGGLMGALTAHAEDLQRGQGSMACIYSADIDADIAALDSLGVTWFQPKTAVGEGDFVVYTAAFKDAAGTLYGLVSMAPELPVPAIPSGLGSGDKPPANSLSTIELYGDFAKVKQLFGELFGWGLLDTMPRYMMFNPGGGIGGVFQSHTPAGHSMPYIYVEDVSAKLQEIEAAGGKRVGEPMAMPGMGTFGYFTDPNGINLGLIGP